MWLTKVQWASQVIPFFSERERERLGPPWHQKLRLRKCWVMGMAQFTVGGGTPFWPKGPLMFCLLQALSHLYF